MLYKRSCAREKGTFACDDLWPQASMDPIFIPSRQLHLSFHHKLWLERGHLWSELVSLQVPSNGVIAFFFCFNGDNVFLNLGVERNKQLNEGKYKSKTVTQPMAWGRDSGKVKSVDNDRVAFKKSNGNWTLTWSLGSFPQGNQENCAFLRTLLTYSTLLYNASFILPAMLLFGQLRLMRN